MLHALKNLLCLHTTNPAIPNKAENSTPSETETSQVRIDYFKQASEKRAAKGAFLDAIRNEANKNEGSDKQLYTHIWKDTIKFTFIPQSSPLGREDNDRIVLSNMESSKPLSGQRHGGKFMDRVTELADQFNVEVFTLPAASPPISSESLEEWYKRHGFKELEEQSHVPDYDKDWLKYTPNQD